MSIEISVIVPVRLAEKTLRSTLDSLLTQIAIDPGIEARVVVCEDDPSAPIAKSIEHPRLHISTVAGVHGVPYLRRLGVAASNAPFIVIAEDHCLFPESWARKLVEGMTASGADVTGGPVVNGRLSFVGWAQYFTRYSSFMPPRKEGWTTSLPGNNACYRRESMETFGEYLREGFWEAEFNQALMRGNRRMWMCSDVSVIQRQERGAFGFIPLRFRHGRCYGGRRVQDSPGQRTTYLLRAPLIPLVLLVRIARAIFGRKDNRLRFLWVLPLLTVYLCSWAAGEVTGYLLGAGRSCEATD